MHRPSIREEEVRICADGGYVDEDGQRNGLIGVSRSLGDVALPPPRCHEPSVRFVPLAASAPHTLVVASDGLWDVVQPAELPGLIAAAAEATDGSESSVAAALRDEAFARGSTDNITVALVALPPTAPPDSPPRSPPRSPQRAVEVS